MRIHRQRLYYYTSCSTIADVISLYSGDIYAVEGTGSYVIAVGNGCIWNFTFSNATVKHTNYFSNSSFNLLFNENSMHKHKQSGIFKNTYLQWKQKSSHSQWISKDRKVYSSTSLSYTEGKLRHKTRHFESSPCNNSKLLHLHNYFDTEYRQNNCANM